DSPGTATATADSTANVTSTAPVLGGGGNTVFWTEGNAATVIDPGLTVSDTSSASLTESTVTISSGFLAGDQLDFTNQNGITGNYSASTGVLTLSGPSSVANYQAALDTVSYSSTSSSPSEAGADSVRTISAGDQIDGGGGTNALELVGAGTFNMMLPTTLADIQLITAQEGQAAYAA